MPPSEQQKPWWELPAASPEDPHFKPERERLRAELARAWRARGNQHERRQERRLTSRELWNGG
jgi:hypothetical protein